MAERKHKIVASFGGAEVNRDARGVPEYFRHWDSIPTTPSFTMPKWGKYIRRSNTDGYPPFDIFSEWLMDFATITAGQLERGDWKNYRRMLLVHVPNCDLYCWYCFNDAWENVDGVEVKEVTVSDIISKYLEYTKQERQPNNEVNILRISGGEPFFRNSELVEDIAKEFLANKDLRNSFLWVDTNLHSFGSKINDNQKKALDALKMLGNRVAVHACIHGATRETLIRNSLQKTEIENIHSILNEFDQRNIPIYPRINPIGLLPEEVNEIFNALSGIKTKMPYPLKTYLGPVELNYDHAIDRMKLFQGHSPKYKISARKPPIGHEAKIPKLVPANIAIYEWNRLLEQNYGVGYGKIPRHFTSGINKIDDDKQYKKVKQVRRWEEVILLCKGWEREAYAQKMLEILSVSTGAWVDVEYENKWIEPGFLAYVYACPDFCKGQEIKILVTACFKERAPGMIPVRWATLKNIKASDYKNEKHSLTLTIEAGDYANGLSKRIPGEKEEGFFERIARYVGVKYLPFATETSCFGRYVGFETEDNPANIIEEQDFKSTIIELIAPVYEGAKKDVYVRIKEIFDSTINKKLTLIEGQLQITEGHEIDIVLEACNPNLGKSGYPTLEQMEICWMTTDLARVRISPERIQLSKYGDHKTRFIFSREGEYRGDIIFKPVKGGARVPSFRIPFRVEVDK